MTSTTSAGMVTEIVVQRDIDRTWDVSGLIRRTAVGLIQPPAHVKDGRRLSAGEQAHQLVDVDQHLRSQPHGIRTGHRHTCNVGALPGAPKSICAAGLAIAVTIPVPNGPTSSKSVAVPLAIPSAHQCESACTPT